MNKISTHETLFCETIVENLLKEETELSPTEKSIAYIRNFARNYRAEKTLDVNLQGYMLN